MGNKMKIGLIDVDGHNFPNLALMKISAYEKAKGNSVEIAEVGKYDRLYMSKVFSFSKDYNGLAFSDEIIKGGTGYGNIEKLPDEIEHIRPDYSLYKSEVAYGFLTRGCVRSCQWCIVPKKEGEIKAHADINEFIAEKKAAVLMDNNVLASEWGLKQIEKIVEMKIKVDFNQGLDARIISDNPEIAMLLARVKWMKPLRMACDTKNQMDSIKKATELLRKYGATPKNYFIYVLVKDVQDALERVEFLRGLKLDPFAQPYRDFTNNKIDKRLKDFSRWVNHKAIFNTVNWENYNRRP